MLRFKHVEGVRSLMGSIQLKHNTKECNENMTGNACITWGHDLATIVAMEKQ